MLRSFRLWMGLAVSGACLWLAVRSVPIVDVGNSLAGGNYVWLVPAVVLQLSAIVTRSQRWVTLLGKSAVLGDAFWAQSIGYLFTNLLPLRAGEPTRVVVMSSKCGLPFVQVTVTALLERLLDVATIVLVLVAVLPWMQVPELVSHAGVAFGGVVLVALTFLLVIVRFSRLGEELIKFACTLFPALPIAAVSERWNELVAGLSPLTRLASARWIVGWSVITWLLSIGDYWCILRTFQPQGAVLEAAFMAVALSLAVAVPSSPGFIGIFQLVGQQALVLPFGNKYDAGSALAIALTAYLTYYLVTTILGLGGLWHFGQSFSGLTRVVSSWRAVGRPPSETPTIQG